MGYANPFISYGPESLVDKCKLIGVDGFIIVDLPPEESTLFRSLCTSRGLSYIPLIAPSTSEERIGALVGAADSFVYVVSAMGVTGARSDGVRCDLILSSKF
jgi:tryptophan synthase